METKRYFDNWSCHEDMVRDFSEGEYDWETGERTYRDIPGMATDKEVVFAVYNYENYSGEAVVLFERDGVLYETQNYHCSCYGLEGRFMPEVTSWEALAIRERPDPDEWSYYLSHFSKEARDAFWLLVDLHI